MRLHPAQPPDDAGARRLLAAMRALGTAAGRRASATPLQTTPLRTTRTNPGLSRRGVLGLGAGAAGAAALAACSPPPPPASGASALALPVDRSATERRLHFANWTQYLDTADNGTHPTLAAFEKASGIRVDYSEDIDDNNTYYNKVAPLLQGRSDYDVDLFVFTDWMAHRLIENQLVQPLDLIEMPHASNLLPAMKQASYDPGRHWSLPWQAGFTGIGYDRRKLGRDLRTLDDLWAPDLKGRVVVVSEMRDTVALVMQDQGVSVSGDFGHDQVQRAMDLISQRISDGWIRRVQGNSYVEDLKSGNAVAGIVWSGDILTLQNEDPQADWRFVIPESGGTLWSDAMLIPITSHHRANAMALMDWYYQPRIAAELAAYVTYVCPVAGAQAEMAHLDPKLAQSWLVFPSDEFIRGHHIEIFRALSPADDAAYGAMWAKVMGE